MNYIKNTKTWLKLDGTCLKQEKKTFNHKTIVKLYIIYKINLCPLNLNSKFTLLNSSFGTVKITKNTDPDKHSHPGYATELINVELFHCHMVKDLVKK